MPTHPHHLTLSVPHSVSQSACVIITLICCDFLCTGYAGIREVRMVTITGDCDFKNDKKIPDEIESQNVLILVSKSAFKIVFSIFFLQILASPESAN
jgi:hypothetical protein